MNCSNIDRIFAIYQALYPSKWFSGRGDQTASTPLYPFLKTRGTDSTDEVYWKSEDVQKWTNLGFAVPGSQELDANGIKELETHLNDFYNWSAVY